MAYQEVISKCSYLWSHHITSRTFYYPGMIGSFLPTFRIFEADLNIKLYIPIDRKYSTRDVDRYLPHLKCKNLNCPFMDQLNK